MNHIVSLRNVKVKYEDAVIFSNITLDIAKGEFIYLLGPTGSGKSSILKLLYADLHPSEGVIKVNDFNVSSIEEKQIPFLRRSLGVIFQDFELLTDRNVLENLIFVMKATGWTSKTSMLNKVDDLLDLVKLPKITKEKMPHQLSGGEQQRVAIARALVNNPDLIIADEPTGNLDPKVSRSILQLFTEINDKGTSIIMATHQHSFLKINPQRTIICEGSEIKDISKEQVQQKLDLGNQNG
ncbi:ATP-binding cassette domain-containing protein [Flammeovirga pectinis]|uniref:Cell division ATP-binding protein FtsE n=1 Tax=Flammeovirga pectinis TaxID=2494373 RepID=A0A3Q9FKX0_9BACT|nr:ATP-binding cassette domain-containing protein [Flammeovirga pectinis]AZQ62044.1 ATP-binding cassette domain-containing protein [Flammeovirga pectinis]